MSWQAEPGLQARCVARKTHCRMFRIGPLGRRGGYRNYPPRQPPPPPQRPQQQGFQGTSMQQQLQQR
jgi:hypothetical protein